MSQSKTYLITGASSGLGHAVAQRILLNNEKVFLVARTADELEALKEAYPNLVRYRTGDLTDPAFIDELVADLPPLLAGAFINAGGPPAGRLEELSLEDWDAAYHLLIRWKVQLTQKLLPLLKHNQYGRLLYSESTSITRPVENLGLSNSLRMAMIGYVKTLVQENTNTGITFNILAPGYHETKALDRLFNKLSEQREIGREAARQVIMAKIPTGYMGQPQDFAALAAWILSEEAGFLNGQVLNLDGGTSV
jgi:3-oxoacyl-[acyl-carrier protein] reductase